MLPNPRSLWPLLALLPTPGCCALAAVFCGPDESPWIQASQRSPEATVATFREAARRNRPDVIYDCLSDRFLARNQLPGRLEAAVAWEKLKDQYGPLHLLGRAEVGPFRATADNRQSVALAIAGETLEFELVADPVWLLTIRTDEGRVRRTRSVADIAALFEAGSAASRPGLAAFLPASELQRVRLAVPAPGQVEELTFAREWRIDSIRNPAAAQGQARP